MTTSVAAFSGERLDRLPLDQEAIALICRRVIQQHPRQLELIGVMASEGGSDRVEIMVTVKGCHAEPCRLLLNLSRSNRAELESELSRTLEEQLVSHVAEAHP